MTPPVLHLHPPKTAGSSIIKAVMCKFPSDIQALYARSFDLGVDSVSSHFTPRDLNIDLTQPMSISVRNPYNRILSQIRWYREQIPLRMPYIKNIDLNRILFESARNKRSPYHRRSFILWASQTEWYELAKGPIAVIKFESLAQDVENVYGITDLPHVHKMPAHKITDWTDVFGEHDQLKLFNEIFQKDFETFDYPIFEHSDDLLEYFQTK